MNKQEFLNVLEISSKEKLEEIKRIIKEFDEDENMETYQALDKIRGLLE